MALVGRSMTGDPADDGIDFLSLGALVMRLDPGVVPFRKAHDFQIHVSGGEFNVAANLASAFGLRAAVATAMVDYPIGHLVAERVRAMGVKSFYRTFAHDGVTGPNIATVYSDRGYGARPPVVFYNRANEAAALLKSGDFDWSAIMADGVSWFHGGGIFAALSSTAPDLLIDAMTAARAVGATVSLDLNYRPKLWAVAGGPSRAQDVLGRITGLVDVLVGNEEDLQEGLGIPGPQVEKTSSLDPSTFVGMIERVIERFPGLKVVATTLRDVQSANHHRWSAVAWIDGEVHVAPTCELTVLDRVGGGDAFAAGLIYGLLTEQPPEEALRLGWAHGALVATYPGDTTMATLDEVRALANAGSPRIQR